MNLSFVKTWSFRLYQLVSVTENVTWLSSYLLARLSIRLSAFPSVKQWAGTEIQIATIVEKQIS